MQKTPITLAGALERDDTFLSLLGRQVRSEHYLARKHLTQHGPHPTDDMLYQYVLGCLDEQTTAWIQDHNALCTLCAEDVLHIRCLEEDVEAELTAWITTPPPKDWLEYVKDISSIPAAHLIRWVSELWQPQWAGQMAMVGASDIPPQQRTVTVTDGEIDISCVWRGTYETTPAYIQVAWAANFEAQGELWAVFFDPKTKEELAEIPLGEELEDGTALTKDTLGFDPMFQPWAISLVFKDHEA